MQIGHLMNRACTVTRRADSDLQDDYGNPIEEETVNETVCELQQQRRTEPANEGETSDTTWLLVLPPATKITTSDTVTVDDQVYELVGDPWAARSPWGRTVSHLECTVRRTA